ncbi:MAG TPA: alkaline phosphatase family protein [Terriglobales bacterium]|nr:alkaline phosphatase family protein [Terriglobales bacterium]
MKICVIGLDGAAPDLLFQDERLVNLRRMMEVGLYGPLESVIPPATVPSWLCLSTSQDPGSLGIYGARRRRGYSYEGLASVGADSAPPCTLWNHMAREMKNKPFLAAIPSQAVHGLSIASFDSQDDPASIQVHEHADERALGEGLRASSKEAVRDAVFAMSRKQWEAATSLLREKTWDYFQFVDTGINRIQHAFWSSFDPESPRFVPGNVNQNVIPDYCRWLDEQIGGVMETLDAETILLLVAPFGVQRLRGALALNQWLLAEGLLVLHETPREATPFDRLKVDWSRTTACSEGGDSANLFFNVQGREPMGVIPAAEYEEFRAQLKDKLLALTSEQAVPLAPQVVTPAEIYAQVRDVAPDLIVNFSGSGWRVSDSVGHPDIYAATDGLDDCSHSQKGMFVLAAPNCPLGGEFQGARLLDLAPTLLDLAGYSVPASMEGRSLAAGMEKRAAFGGSDAEQERIIRERLAGLGYV